jgi:hypothetical protein
VLRPSALSYQITVQHSTAIDIRAASICPPAARSRTGDRGGGTPKIGALSRGSGASQILWEIDGYGPSHGSA